MKWKVEIGPCEIIRIAKDIRGYSWKSTIHPPRGQILLVHGLSTYSLFQWLRHSPPGEMEERGLYYSSSLVEILNRLGMNVYAIDLEGHGLSTHHEKPTMYMTRGLNGCIDDIQHLLDIMKQRNPQLPIIMIGHSIGSLLILRTSQQLHEQHKEKDVSSLIMIAPFIGSNHSVRFYQPIVKIGGFFYPKFIVTNGMKNSRMNQRVTGSIQLPPNLAARCRYPDLMIEKWASIDQETDPLVHCPYSPIYIGLISNIFEQIHKMNRLLRKSKKHAPFLIFHSPHDPICPYSSIVEFYNNSNVSPRSLVSLSDCLHNPLIEENTRPHLYAEITDWILVHLKVSIHISKNGRMGDTLS